MLAFFQCHSTNFSPIQAQRGDTGLPNCGKDAEQAKRREMGSQGIAPVSWFWHALFHELLFHGSVFVMLRAIYKNNEVMADL